MAGTTITLRGSPELQRRLKALGDTGDFMRDLALTAIGEQKRRARVKTGNMRRQIHLGTVTKTSADTIAGANYSAAVEFGTRPREIRPRSRQALRFKGRSGQIVFAKSVRHPGTKAQPFMVPGAEDALGKMSRFFIEKWNRAA